MKLKWKVIVIFNIFFILFVSFKILQPDIEEQGNVQRGGNKHKKAGRGANQLYTSSQKQEERERLLEVLGDKLLLKSEYCKANENPWKIAAGWVKDREIIPEVAPELGCVIHSLKSAKILAAENGIKGTQLKLSLILEGGQVVAFKPKWYERDDIQQDILSGWDRHNGEIAAFHLARLLDLRRTPIAVGRKINLMTDIVPVASRNLTKTFLMKDGNQCIYGQCYYCKPDTPVCAEGDVLEGVVILWLPQRYKIGRITSPWIRSYRPKVHKRWEIDDTYCDKLITTSPYNKGPRLLDIIDAAILDYLVGNADRHHMETLGRTEESMLLIMDNGKSFGNPNEDEPSILAPLKQCCRIRESMWHSLLILQDGVLSTMLRRMLDQDSIAPVLDEKYYTALDRRLLHVLDAVRDCIGVKGQGHVLITNTTAIY